MNIFLETLREFMSENNMNQKQLAEKIENNPTALAYWFAKITCPKVSNLIKITDTFECSIDYLFGFTDEKENLYADKEVTLSIFGKVLTNKKFC